MLQYCRSHVPMCISVSNVLLDLLPVKVVPQPYCLEAEVVCINQRRGRSVLTTDIPSLHSVSQAHPRDASQPSGTDKQSL